MAGFRLTGVKRLAAVACVIVAVASCGNSVNPRAGATSHVTYESRRDGVSLSYPAAWQRYDTSLAPTPTPSIPIVALGTSRLDAKGGCSPYPSAALGQLGEGDLLFVLSVSSLPFPPEEGSGGSPRPADLPDPVEGGAMATADCEVEGIQDRVVNFVENGQEYSALLATRGPITASLRQQLEDVWDSLVLTPIGETAGQVAPETDYWHVLYTHCGIRGTRFDGQDWVADPPLDDGSGNPPKGWSNPSQAGYMRLQGTRATFVSRDETLTASFRPRVSDDPAAEVCA